MVDIILECIRTLVIGLILFYIWKIGRVRGLNTQKGWSFVITGWALIFFGSFIDITDNFEELNWLIVVGDTEVESFLEKFVGFLVGYIMLFIGFLHWLPAGAKRIDRMKKEFVSTVSHELRTPLTSIFASVKLVTSGVFGEIPEKAKDTLDIALRNSERLTIIVNDILDVDKLESGKMVFHCQPEKLTELVNASIDENKHYGEQFEVQYRLHEDNMLATVNVDRDRFIQVMSNLLSNAAKFSPSGSTVDITLRKKDGSVRVSVKDKGIGIKEECYPYIFQKFSQIDNSNKRHVGGTGLGLVIAKGFVEKMGGTIGFTSVEDEGTEFYIDLPEMRSAGS